MCVIVGMCVCVGKCMCVRGKYFLLASIPTASIYLLCSMRPTDTNIQANTITIIFVRLYPVCLSSHSFYVCLLIYPPVTLPMVIEIAWLVSVKFLSKLM